MARKTKKSFKCAECKSAIKDGDSMLEVQTPSTKKAFLLHTECFTPWMLEKAPLLRREAR
jgi:hypothetical protein